ncbi:MAG: coproporphyrinogen III oxidase [Nitrospirales bacterium]|nr:MAG: coproporphyrinogen III oxidase [Nitrospirales bacterium]
MSRMEPIWDTLCQRIHMDFKARDLGLYVHIPFCQKRCHFCAFYLTSHRENRIQDFLSALAQEISLYSQSETCHRFPISTIYFGGGTPTSLESVQLASILDLIHQHFTVDPAAEITIEADPETVSRSSLQELHDAGVTRLSLGVQSLEESEWQQLGRLGQMETVSRAMADVKDSGFTNVSLDVMYGLPGQTLETWQYSLEKVLELFPTHLSCYALTIEEGTKFHRDVREGKLGSRDVELETAMHEQAVTCLESAGYYQYEVSNFAKAGWECQHNLRYWSGLDYLGLGPSAQSYVCGMRFGNISDLSTYSHSLQTQDLPVDFLDALSVKDVARERVIFGLRLNKGVPIHELTIFENDQLWQSTVDRLIEDGLLSVDHQYLKVTSLGRQFIDTLALQLS